MKYKIIRTTKQGSHFQIVYDVLDDNDNLLVGGLSLSIKKELDKTELDKLFKDVIYPSFDEEINEEKETIYTEKEVEDLLKEKGHLKENEKLSDLKNIVEVK